MKEKKRRRIGAGLVVVLWLVLTAAVWCKPADSVSEAERRKLAQFPEASLNGILSGAFMEDFESYAADQFPLRDAFRQLKARFSYDVLGQGDNNGIYLAEGYAAALEYPLNETSVSNAVAHINGIYETYLKDSGSEIYLSIVPDKGYYLAEENGYPAMDYETLFQQVEQGTSWAEFVDITDCLTISDYYRTDTHWRQEKLFSVAEKLCSSLGVMAPRQEDHTQTALERDFYGVYYGQAALPMEPETMYLMESKLLENCTVYNHETGKTTGIYDREKLSSQDLYDVFLSGATPLLTIENPGGEPGRELIVFRDSFGSSLIPLLLQDYSTVTVVDTRYLSAGLLGEYVDFHGQDVLFLYSTLLLNSSSALKS